MYISVSYANIQIMLGGITMEINPLLSATYGNITRLIHFIFSIILTYSQSTLTRYFLDLLSQADLQIKKTDIRWLDERRSGGAKCLLLERHAGLLLYFLPHHQYYFIPPLTGVNINYSTDITQISCPPHHHLTITITINTTYRGERRLKGHQN